MSKVNLLVNGDFEGGYRPTWDESTQTKPHHTAHVYEVDRTGGPITKRYTVERAEIHNPAGWWAWYAHQRNNNPVPWDPNNRIGWAEPEVRLTETVHQRHRSGLVAAYLFTWRRIHEGGFFQQVAVTLGARLRFSAYTHAWIGDDDHPPTWSLPGYGALAWPVGTPGLSDGQRSVTQSVGIDPTGGTDPYAPTVVWSPGWHIFNAYRAEPLAVEAVAAGDKVTVFLRSSTLWPVVHNDVAWDDAALEYIDAEPGPEPGGNVVELGPGSRKFVSGEIDRIIKILNPDAPPAPEPFRCPGAPRIQYPRVTNVLPADTDPERAAQIFKMLWGKGHQAVTGSYDDAGIGALEDKTAVLWNIPESQEQVYRDWYAEHYPGTVVRFESYVDTGIIIPKVLCQRDPEWRDRKFGSAACNLTIGRAGCFITAVAEAQRYYNIRADATPVTVDETVGAEGYATCLLKWAAISSNLGMTITSSGDLNAHLDAGRVALLRVLPESPEHFVLAVKRVGGDYLIRDPLYGTEELLSNRYRGIHSFRLLTPKDQPLPPAPPAPPVPPAPPESQNPEPERILGLHLQDWGDLGAVMAFHARRNPTVVKVFTPEMAANLAAAGRLVVYRHCLTREQELACLADPQTSAAWFLDQFAEQIAPLVEEGLINYVETAINETMDGDRVQAAVNFELAFIAELARRLPRAKPLVATIAVGNPHESQYPLLLPLAREVERVGGAFGYHAYWPVERGHSFLESDWQWHAGRFEGMDALFRANGIRVDWLLSECGPCGGSMVTTDEGTRWFAYDPAAGWRHPQCFNGDWNATRADIETFRRRLNASPARVLGATLFTVCPWDWQYFNLGAAELATL